MITSTLFLLSLLAQAAAPSPEAKTQAKALLQEGTQLYEQGGYADALDRFEKAYAMFPSPKLLYNMGKTLRELDRPVPALDAFERFIAESSDLPPEMVADAKRLAEELSLKVGNLSIECRQKGAEIAVDGKKIGEAPIKSVIRVLPGSHQVTATHPSAIPAIENVNVSGGATQVVAIRLSPLAVASTPVADPLAPSPGLDLKAARPMPSSGAKRHRTWTWIAAGSTALLAGGATVAGLAMRSKFNQLADKCDSRDPAALPCSPSDINALDARKNTANLLWGLTAVAGVTAVVLFFVEGRPVTVAPAVGQHMGLVAEVGY